MVYHVEKLYFGGYSMLTINVVPEDLHFFKYMKKAENEKHSREICETNPLFSWHAVRFCKSWSKNLLLVNDLTGFPLVIPNTMYDRKEQLEDKILQRINCVFQNMGLTELSIDHYFHQSSAVQYAQAFRKTPVILARHYADYIIYATKHRKEISDIKNNLILAQMPIRNGAEFEIPFHLMKQALSRRMIFSLPEKGATFSFSKNNYHVKKTWLPLSSWDEYVEVEMDYQIFTKYCMKIRENNSLVFEQFGRYLFEYCHLSLEEVDQHLDLVEVFLDEFLLIDTISSPFSNYNDIAFFINHWYIHYSYWSNKETVRQSGASLKLFYHFLAQAGEISANQLNDILEYIQDGINSGIYSLETGICYNFYSK